MNGIGRGEVGPEVTALSLPETMRRQIRTEVRRAHPEECCGLLIGRVEGEQAVVTAHIPSSNRAPDRRTGFEIDSALLLSLQRDSRDIGKAVLGHYHSHPQGPAGPSAADHERAWTPGHVWLIAAPAPGDESLAFSAHLAVEEAGRITLRAMEIVGE